MADEEVHIVEDPPTPALPDVEQRDLSYDAVKVEVCGPVYTQSQPARLGAMLLEYLGTAPIQILAPDLRRSAATFCCTEAWTMSRKANGLQLPFPADTPIVIQHADEVWAASSASGILSVIVEVYAQ